MQQFKCVVFDVDGTLLDTSEGILAALKLTIEKFNLEPLGEQTLRSFIGPPVQNSFKNIYGFEDNVISEMAATFRNMYKEDVYLLQAKPYEGIYKVFDYLNSVGIKPAIATYKREDYALRLLKHFNFDNYTNIIYGSDFEGKLNKADIIELALKKAGITDYSQALMIGDSDNDAVGASNLGTKFLGVTYGFGFKTKEDIYKFNAIGASNSTREIIDIISEGNK